MGGLGTITATDRTAEDHVVELEVRSLTGAGAAT
jgi:hypothetical protein